ncbi:MAG: DUF4156 domain-containing protein [Luteimonas sp.]
MSKLALLIPIALLANACTWVHMAPGASAVRVLSAAPAGCEQRGEVSVAVTDEVMLYRRKAVRVREELETLARNEAPSIGADAISPLEPPVDGTQRFAAWRCDR